jgi:hypothetical protein
MSQNHQYSYAASWKTQTVNRRIVRKYSRFLPLFATARESDQSRKPDKGLMVTVDGVADEPDGTVMRHFPEAGFWPINKS